MTIVAGLVAGLILLGVAGLQAALALGAPLGRFAWGGKHPGTLPERLQLASTLSVPILLVMAMIVLIRAGVIYPGWAPAMIWPCWAVFLFLVVNTFANLASESRAEKLVMTPVAGAGAVLAGLVNIAG